MSTSVLKALPDKLDIKRHSPSIFGTRDLFNISYSRELYLFSKFLHFEEIVCVKMAVYFEMIVIKNKPQCSYSEICLLLPIFIRKLNSY